MTKDVYVADTGNHRIQVFSGTGAYKRKWGSLGTDNGQFSNPQGIAVDGVTGEVYVADTDNHRIQVFNSTGGFLRGIGNGITWGTPTAATAPASGNLNGWFNYPNRIALDAGVIYVTDFYNNRVQKFNRSGGFVTKWGRYGGQKGQFNSPAGIAVDGEHSVFVVDYGNQRIQKFAPSGRFINTWGSYGSLYGQLSNPEGVAVANGNNWIYVVDSGNNRIQRYERFGFSLSVTPASRTITKGTVGTYTVTLTGVGPNTFGSGTALCILSGMPGTTTASFSPPTVVTVSGSPRTSILSLSTGTTTQTGTYTVYVEAVGGGQTRVRSLTLSVKP